MIMNDELEGTWEKASVSYFNSVSQIFLEGPKKTAEFLRLAVLRSGIRTRDLSNTEC